MTTSQAVAEFIFGALQIVAWGFLVLAGATVFYFLVMLAINLGVWIKEQLRGRGTVAAEKGTPVQPMSSERWWQIVDIADTTIPGGPLLPLLRECLREIDRAQRATLLTNKTLTQLEDRLKLAQEKLIKAHRSPV